MVDGCCLGETFASISSLVRDVDCVELFNLSPDSLDMGAGHSVCPVQPFTARASIALSSQRGTERPQRARGTTLLLRVSSLPLAQG